jgi:hypothetical protein
MWEMRQAYSEGELTIHSRGWPSCTCPGRERVGGRSLIRLHSLTEWVQSVL